MKKIKSFPEFTAALSRACALDAEVAKENAALKKAVAEREDRAREKNAPKLEEREEIAAECRRYAEENKAELKARIGRNKSATCAGGKWGWKKAARKLIYPECVEKFLAKIKAAKLGAKLIRKKEEPNKSAIKLATPEQLKKIGVKVEEGGEVFFFKAND